MAVEFLMPQLGLTMTEGIVGKWFKSVGDTIAVGDLLVEVETEKITNQLESTAAGTILEILAPEGITVPVQTPIAVIGQPGEKVNRSAAADAGTVHSAGDVAVVALNNPSNEGMRIKASPLARRMAAEHGIYLETVPGTGPEGRIVERDIAVQIERDKVKTAPLAAESETGLHGIRKVIADRMSMSWQNVPHVNMTVEVDMTAASDLKYRLGTASGIKISFTEIILKCAAEALREFKSVNASLVADKIQFHGSINVGVAVALDNGLIVPVIKNADRKSVEALHDEIGELILKARQGKLSQDEIQGGTFTVTNLGMFGVDHFTPIINQPESAILGVCRVVERPVALNGAIVIRPMMNLNLSFDHRLIDGAVAARFLSRIRQLLEQPLSGG